MSEEDSLDERATAKAEQAGEQGKMMVTAIERRQWKQTLPSGRR